MYHVCKCALFIPTNMPTCGPTAVCSMYVFCYIYVYNEPCNESGCSLWWVQRLRTNEDLIPNATCYTHCSSPSQASQSRHAIGTVCYPFAMIVPPKSRKHSSTSTGERRCPKFDRVQKSTFYQHDTTLTTSATRQAHADNKQGHDKPARCKVWQEWPGPYYAACSSVLPVCLVRRQNGSSIWAQASNEAAFRCGFFPTGMS